MMKIQFFKKKWLTDFRQMSHMKIEPQPDTEKPPDNVQNVNAVDKQEEEEEEDDLDDTMTEAAPSPDSAEIIEAETVSVPVREQQETERGRDKDLDREKERDRERRSNGRSGSRSKDRNDLWEIERCVPSLSHADDNNGEAVPIASRIRIRRQTMLVEQISSPKPAKPTKRRLSAMTERVSETDSNRNRSSAEIVNETAPNKAKRIRFSDGVPEKQAPSKSIPEPVTRPIESTPKQSKHSSNHAKSTPVTSNRKNSTAPGKSTPSSTTTTTKTTTAASTTLLTPGKSTAVLGPANKSTPKNRDKKSKGPSTPLITQFFSQSSPLKCDNCSAILNSRNELNFHAKIHKRGRCIKCKETIDNNNIADSIHKHMISCLFLSNEIPKEYLTHLLKVKVDLDRLTPRKIDEIQRSLRPVTAADSVARKKPGPKSKQRERYLDGPEVANRSEPQSDETAAVASEVTTKDTQKLTDKNGEILADKAPGAAKAANEDGNDDKPVTKKSKAKKTPSKPKNTSCDVSEEFTIAGNQTAALNWIDETLKEKPFSLRNFETDKPIYNNIKSVPIADVLTKQKLATIIKNINQRKGNTIGLANENGRKSHGLNETTPAKQTEIGMNQSKPVENGSNRASSNVPTVQPPLQSPIQNSSTTAHNSSIPIKTPTRLNPPQVPVVQPVIAISLAPPNASQAVASPVANATGGPMLPQLLSLPARVPMRLRAMSMHTSQNEYSAAGRLSSMRRQSVCDNNPPAKTNSPSALSKVTALDHSYTNSTAAKAPETTNKMRLNAVQYLPLPYMTKVHHVPPAPAQPQPQPQAKTPKLPTTTLKVLTPDDLNSRAMNAAQPSQASPNPRMDSPNSTENHLNNNQVTSTKQRPRTKTTPLRPLAPAPSQLSDDANISISVSLSRVGKDYAELILTLEQQRLQYDNLTMKRKQEVQQSLLKDNVWLQMLNHLKDIQPTNETLALFEKILPKPQQNQFFAELKRVYGNRIG
ncbi:nucleolar protein dao-5-like isoform X2 [Sitodiplosis mosellana]|uniref:nucleolar protein dao-5-like isoform X2 n=1 Tax=Sitodiplosis mosellana TaxID=263140 RepID=UPI0024437F9B|nr:nucleolar protein dao-5-like isoform X2 [Sitodiplosis mosellana]